MLANRPPRTSRADPVGHAPPDRAGRAHAPRQPSHRPWHERPRQQPHVHPRGGQRIAPSPKVRDPPLRDIVHAAHVAFGHRGARPSRARQHFGLKSVPLGAAVQSIQQRQRINPKPTLAVGDIAAALPEHHEIRRPSPQPADARIVRRGGVTRSQDEGIRTSPADAEQSWNLRGVELPVTVDGYNVGRAELGRPRESDPQGGGLAAVVCMRQNGAVRPVPRHASKSTAVSSVEPSFTTMTGSPAASTPAQHPAQRPVIVERGRNYHRPERRKFHPSSRNCNLIRAGTFAGK